MKKTSKIPKIDRDELRPEYRFDYGKARPNRFAARMSNTIAVVLEPDVAQVFNSSESVNQLLRSVIAAMPRQNPRPRATRRKT